MFLHVKGIMTPKGYLKDEMRYVLDKGSATWYGSINVKYHLIIILLLIIKARLLDIYSSSSVSYYLLNLAKFENKEKLYSGGKAKEEVYNIV